MTTFIKRPILPLDETLRRLNLDENLMPILPLGYKGPLVPKKKTSMDEFLKPAMNKNKLSEASMSLSGKLLKTLPLGKGQQGKVRTLPGNPKDKPKISTVPGNPKNKQKATPLSRRPGAGPVAMRENLIEEFLSVGRRVLAESE